MPDFRDGFFEGSKIQPVIFIIETSGSMYSEHLMAAINSGMKEAIIEISSFQKDYPEYSFQIGILVFNTYSQWITDSLVPVEDYQWLDFVAGGLSNYGEALASLNERLSRREFFDDPLCIGYCKQVIVFITEGASSDDYKTPLEDLGKNKWFKVSRKIVVDALNSDEQMTRDLCGGNGHIYTASSFDELKELIKEVGTRIFQYHYRSDPEKDSDNGKSSDDESTGVTIWDDSVWDDWD